MSGGFPRFRAGAGFPAGRDTRFRVRSGILPDQRLISVDHFSCGIPLSHGGLVNEEIGIPEYFFENLRESLTEGFEVRILDLVLNILIEFIQELFNITIPRLHRFKYPLGKAIISCQLRHLSPEAEFRGDLRETFKRVVRNFDGLSITAEKVKSHRVQSSPVRYLRGNFVITFNPLLFSQIEDPFVELVQKRLPRLKVHKRNAEHLKIRLSLKRRDPLQKSRLSALMPVSVLTHIHRMKSLFLGIFRNTTINLSGVKLT
ncbi:MAG: hypothetical protein BWY44_01187 [Candidatus Omnitrophica bacterium ADurb.Bin292]|nr:MAG: hypothetical protein BWY44_01187 [Candidatus Omnitrophica bacterium ADurb.Bin292]